MKRPYYLFTSGRLSRRNGTLAITRKEGDRLPDDGDDNNGEPSLYHENGREVLPIEQVSSVYLFGEVDLNTRLVTLLARFGIPAFFFDYYGNYTATLHPKGIRQSGTIRLAQAEAILNPHHRLEIARVLVGTAAQNMTTVLRYYARRESETENRHVLQSDIRKIRRLIGQVEKAPSVDALRGVEGSIREHYFGAWNAVLKASPETFRFDRRTRRPPGDPINALISFGNSLCYAAVLRQLQRTPLDDALSYLHEPGERRATLSLDLAEVFKPMLVDRTIFRLVNRREIRSEHFTPHQNGCYLTEEGRRIFVAHWDHRLHRSRFRPSLGRYRSPDGLILDTVHSLLRHLRDPDNVPFQPYHDTGA